MCCAGFGGTIPSRFKPALRKIKGQRHYISEFLDPGHDWELVSDGYKFTEGPAVSRDGSVYFCDSGDSKIYKIGADGKPAALPIRYRRRRPG